MDSRKIYDFLFQLFEYADYLADEIQPNNADNNSYFMSLIYIEDIMDSYGRGLINQSAHELNDQDNQSLKEAHRRIDLLRQRIMDLKAKYDFDNVVAARTEILVKDWDLNREQAN